MSIVLDLDSKINSVHPVFAKKLGLPIRPTDIGAQKIDGTTLDIYGMVIAAFFIENKANQVRFFEEIFLVTNVSPKVVLRMSFFTLSDANLDFLGCELW